MGSNKITSLTESREKKKSNIPGYSEISGELSTMTRKRTRCTAEANRSQEKGPKPKAEVEMNLLVKEIKPYIPQETLKNYTD